MSALFPLLFRPPSAPSVAAGSPASSPPWLCLLPPPSGDSGLTFPESRGAPATGIWGVCVCRGALFSWGCASALQGPLCRWERTDHTPSHHPKPEPWECVSALRNVPRSDLEDWAMVSPRLSCRCCVLLQGVAWASRLVVVPGCTRGALVGSGHDEPCPVGVCQGSAAGGVCP